ncbi:NYN domain-containing protein [Phycisphaerales bacterium AB-hyl4]|uniref:NYN domain-containing protein n=1 Tax=Natronomicrosphaera hydrolytica TaxID=3242702 RepID=A0ABV4U0N5_9BACT
MLLIDAYNVLHTTMPPALAGLDAAGLCLALARTPWREQSIKVVCDGQPGPLGLLDSPTDAVELLYSGVNRTADAVIIDHVNHHTAPRRLTVVSSDHEIRKAARRRRATTWTSEQFIHQLVEALRQGNHPTVGPEKPTGTLDDAQTRNWLKAFGYKPEDNTST